LPVDRRINLPPPVEIRENAHGLGVFATREITKGEDVIWYTGAMRGARTDDPSVTHSIQTPNAHAFARNEQGDVLIDTDGEMVPNPTMQTVVVDGLVTRFFVERALVHPGDMAVCLPHVGALVNSPYTEEDEPFSIDRAREKMINMEKRIVNNATNLITRNQNGWHFGALRFYALQNIPKGGELLYGYSWHHSDKEHKKSHHLGGFENTQPDQPDQPEPKRRVKPTLMTPKGGGKTAK
jgi:hypothetical protein